MGPLFDQNKPSQASQGKTYYFIDSHAHLDMKPFKGDLDKVIQSAKRAGLKKILTIALSLPAAHQTMRLCQQYPDVLVAALGIHPHDAQKVTDHTFPEMAKILASHKPPFVALGEIGLDYYRDLSPRQNQQRIFRQQLRLAKEVHLPVLIHCRDAQADTFSIMKEEGVAELGGVMHCFSGDEEFARQCLTLGLFLSFAGPLTYHNSQTLQRVVKQTPLDRILVETDCPYLPPVPYRGQRNEPAYVVEVIQKVAEIKNIPIPELATQIAINFNQAFLA